MAESKMDFELATKEMLIKWLAGIPFLEKEEKRMMFEIGCRFKNKMEPLYQIYGAIAAGNEHFCDSEQSITYEQKQNNDLLTCNGETLVLTEEQLKTVLSGIIDIMEHVLPLGSVVDLKKDFLKNVIENTDKVENFRVVITDRFFYQKGDRLYFPYAGVLYPIGAFEKQERLNFTSAVIENVIHEGYSDQQEEAYVFLMKQELILENGMHSFGFSTEEERKEYQKKRSVQK